jgi:hypothetical protein
MNKKLKKEVIKLAKHHYKLRQQYPSLVDFKRGAGYYIHIGFGVPSSVGKMTMVQEYGGVEGTLKLIDYKTYSDPWDMIESSGWQLISLKNRKPIDNCSRDEFISRYYKLFIKKAKTNLGL